MHWGIIQYASSILNYEAFKTLSGTNKKGKNLESHRLWRQIVSLTPKDAKKVLKGIVNQQFSIEEAIQVIFNSYSSRTRRI